ncbi:InlB B-repeat-containing protein [Pyxidicoccus caerfyrddinensis]|uniref:InlB B-repeat-containing protein n=1 Tax=Pyxidicoccus caerfyrddinensis TaxID=2709663 RepID=UPI003B839986
MKTTLLAVAAVLVLALPGRAVAQTRCYQAPTSLPPQAATFTPTRTSCSITPQGACWHQVISGSVGLPPYVLWLAAPSSWNFKQCQFFDYRGANASGDPIIRWLFGPASCDPIPCNTQPPTPPNYTLSVNLAGFGNGVIVSSPAGINWGVSVPTPTLSASFPSGTVVTLTATPNALNTFDGWSGAGCSGTGTCTVTVTANTSVTATFTPHSVCGDGLCTELETSYTCPFDCRFCGDDICTEDEAGGSCPEDCVEICGDGICGGREDPWSCYEDC